MTPLPATWWLLASLLWLVAAPTQAQAQCLRLAAPITDHSCFHARLGPFRSVTAVPTSAPVAEDVNAVHTYYTVKLPSADGAGKLSYTPARTGRWAIYVQHEVPYQVRQAGQPLTAIHQDVVPGCPYFAQVSAFQLAAGAAVEIVLGPTTASEVGLVLERLEDFEVLYGRDRDGDGFGDPADVIASPCTPAAGYVANDEDCDDADPQEHPGAAEVCGGPDRNCNGRAGDDGVPCQSGLGACAATGVLRCLATGAPATCDAVAAAPRTELCEGSDTDCDGVADLAEPGLCGGPEQPRCVSDGRGGSACGCERDADCGPGDSGRLCSLRGTEQRCIEGCIEGFGRNGCSAGWRCTSADPAAPGVCEPEASGPEVGCGCGSSPPTLLGGLMVLLALVWRRRRAAHG